MNVLAPFRCKHFDLKLKKCFRTDIARVTLLAVFSIVLLSFITTRSVSLERDYVQHYPRFFDAINYDIKDVELFLSTTRENRFKVALDEVHSNGRNVFRTVPLLLFCPRLLSKPFGHLATSLPLLFLFCLFLGAETYRHSKSILFSAVAILSLLTVPGLSNPILGYAANWADMPAAMAMGTAVICLLRFLENSKLVWLAAFGIFSSITMTCRWSAAFYLIFYSFPVALSALYLYVRNRKKSALTPTLVLLACISPGLIFVLCHWNENRYYYSTFGYALNATFWECLRSTANTIFSFVQMPTLVVLLSLIALNFLGWLMKRRRGQWIILLANFWFPLSIMVFLCLVIKAASAPHATLYLVPALFISAFITNVPLWSKRIVLTPLIATIIAVAVCWSYCNYYKLWALISQHPPIAVKQDKLIDTTLSDYLAQNRRLVYSEYDDERVMATLDCFYKWGWYATPALKNYTVHESYYKGWYPNETPEQIAAQVYEDTARQVDVILIHQKTKELLNNPLIDNAYSRAVSVYMTNHIPKDKRWRKVQILDGPNGRLAMFENLCRQH